jgi:surfeit locus 1 family protein
LLAYSDKRGGLCAFIGRRIVGQRRANDTDSRRFRQSSLQPYLCRIIPKFCRLMNSKRAPLIAYLCLLPILLALGVWQLNRADEKRALLKLQERRQSTEALLLSATLSDTSEALLYKTVRAVGHYDGDHQYLLDNQVNKGKVGYFVLTPLRLKNENKAVLVNRGWLPLGHSRADLPGINVELKEITITGRINRFPSVGLKLAGAETPTESWPALVQVVDTHVLAKQLAYPLFNFQIELDKEADYGFKREWREPTGMTPEKHLGYAVQWFLLAITLTLLFVKYGITKK